MQSCLLKMKRAIALFSLLTLCACAPVNTVTPPRPLTPPIQPSATSALNLESAFADHKKWTRLTNEPINVSPLLWGLCRLPTKEETALLESDHKDRFINVYVNTIGESAMRKEGTRVFPSGSVIVKEKLLEKNDSTAAALGVMIKISASEWEFVYQEKNTVTRGNELKHCQACHSAQAERDSVFYPKPFLNP